jgi:hypothetical protein
MAVDDVLTLRVVGRYQDQNIVNTLHYRITAQQSPENDICSALAQQWSTDVQSAWVGDHSDAYTLVGLKAFRQSGVSNTPYFVSIGAAGLVAGDGMPAFVCRTITLYTDSANHRRRGRVMLSGTPVATVDATDGSLTTAEISNLDTLGILLAQPIEAANDSFQLCIPATDVLPVEDITDTKARETPSSVTNRRIRQFLIG